jgi:hypothetical protein
VVLAAKPDVLTRTILLFSYYYYYYYMSNTTNKPAALPNHQRDDNPYYYWQLLNRSHIRATAYRRAGTTPHTIYGSRVVATRPTTNDCARHFFSFIHSFIPRGVNGGRDHVDADNGPAIPGAVLQHTSMA